MIGRAIGAGFAAAREAIAAVLVRLGATPNAVSLLGIVFTAAAGVCLALGADAPGTYPLLAGGLLVLAAACDMLDGAVARLGNCATPFGAFLDSTLDRFSDFAVYAGIAAFYAARGNVTFVLLAMLAVFNAFSISYAKARAENLIPACPVGYWQRGERFAAVLIATFGFNVPALLVQQAILPAFTTLRRVAYTRAVLRGRRPIVDPRHGGIWLKLRLWSWPRKTIPYDLVTAANIAWLVFARFSYGDPVGRWLGA